MTTADDYINTVLDMLPHTMPSRVQIATELRGHIDERLAQGQTIDEILRQLGDPAQLADSYLSAEPLVSAPFLSRAAAKIIDVIVLLLVMCPLAWALSQLVPPDFRPVVMLLIVLVGGSVVFGVYTALTERRYGRTLGKRMMGLRVVRESGARIGLGQAVVRQLPAFFQVYWIDACFALFTDKSQRAFELLSKTRVVRALVFSVLLFVAAPVFARSAVIGPPPGALIDVGGRKLHVRCSGAGAPTVVLEAGASAFAIDWSLVQPEIARTNRVCSYDRSGHGWSDGYQRTPSEIVSDLHVLMGAIGEKPPYVMVGASMGGIYTRLYQAQYPAEVAGLVFVDGSHERFLFTLFEGKGVPIGSLTAEQIRTTIPPGATNVPRRPPQTGAPFDHLPADLYKVRIALETQLITSVPESVPHEVVLAFVEGQRAAFSKLRELSKQEHHVLKSAY
ncbi:MAG TPA: alpha/beta fold hydrolase [Vicinamibacterales bacterium]|nr:alpha/beta fold hydrolase [Vicinamibacterales bacterium]